MAPLPAPVAPAAPTGSAPGAPRRGADNRPPVSWSQNDLESVQDMDREFDKFYEDLGETKLPATQRGFRSRLQQTTWEPNSGVVGHEHQMKPAPAAAHAPEAESGSPTHEETFFTGCFKSEDEAMVFRARSLATLQEAQRGVEPGSQLWQRLQGRIASFTHPTKRLEQGPRLHNENTVPPHVDPRRPFGTLQDVHVGGGRNPNIETPDRCLPAIKVMQIARILPGQNGEYKAGTTWGPTGASAADLDDSDRKVVDTHHAFIPRHYRPHRIGLGYHGYEEVFRHQRDGVPFTSADLTKTSWNQDRNGPIQFVREDGSLARTVNQPLRHDNLALEKQSTAFKDDLKTILENHERAKQHKNQLKRKRAATEAAEPSASAPAAPPSTQPQLWTSTWKRR